MTAVLVDLYLKTSLNFWHLPSYLGNIFYPDSSACGPNGPRSHFCTDNTTRHHKPPFPSGQVYSHHLPINAEWWVKVLQDLHHTESFRMGVEVNKAIGVAHGASSVLDDADIGRGQADVGLQHLHYRLRWRGAVDALQHDRFALSVLARLPRPRLLLSVSSVGKSFPSRSQIPFRFSLLMSQAWFLSFFPLFGFRFLIGWPWGKGGLLL